MSPPACWQLPLDIRLEEVFQLTCSIGRPDRLLAVVRLDSTEKGPTFLTPEAFEAAEEIFEGRVLSKRFAYAWPGTELVGHDALVYVVAFEQSLAKKMSERGPLLFDWVHWPESRLPEDLCLYRKDSPWPFMYSVTHDRDGYLLCDETSFGLERCIELSPEVIEEFIPSGEPDFLRLGNRRDVSVISYPSS